MTVTLRIDGTAVAVSAGTSILQAAREAASTGEGVSIPTLCHMDGIESYTSCMVCLVEDCASGRLLPACSTPAAEGSEIATTGHRLQEARKAAVELLLSEHIGDCEAPCRRACPAFMHIPKMVRRLLQSDLDEALRVVREHIPFPSILGRICPAPCENACRRGRIDRPVAVCLLKRFTGDYGRSPLPNNGPAAVDAAPSSRGHATRVAILGAGPAGLSAAYYLLEAGVSCDIYDDHPLPGGMLRYGVESRRLPPEVLESELDIIRDMGAAFKMNTAVDMRDLDSKFIDMYDAVILATGSATGAVLGEIDSPKVFAAGDMLRGRQSKLAVRAVAEGRKAACRVRVHLAGTGEVRRERFDSRIGKLEPEELELIADIHGISRADVSGVTDRAADKGRSEFDPGAFQGLEMKEVELEAARCLQCDCIRQDSCQLRKIADEYGADQRRFRAASRVSFERQLDKGFMAFESGKCIKCGLCVRIAEREQERIGLTFSGRSYETKIKMPFDEPLSVALEKTARQCAAACPSGALAMERKNPEKSP